MCALLAAALLAATSATLAAAPAAQAATTTASDLGAGGEPILFVFDVSGSMEEADSQGTPKLEGAKSGTTDVIFNLPATASVGVWAYPNDGDCGAGASILDVSTLDRSLLTSRIQALQPDGNTPTAAALRAATDDLKKQGYKAATIVLVSDGLANCDADPCEVARQITGEGFQLTVNTAGFVIDDEGRQQLQCIADATGGTYVDVADADQLADTLAAATAPALQLNVDGLNGTTRAGGSNTVTATITNTSPSVPALDVSVSLSFRAGNQAQYPAALPPRIRLGNIPPGGTATRTWTWSTPAGGAAYGRVVAQARGVAPVAEAGTMFIVKKDATLADAGPILNHAKRVAVLGDSYSSGEGTKDYFDLDKPSSDCHRSSAAYGMRLYQSKDGIAMIACSGAITADYYNPNPDRDRLPQDTYLHRLFSRKDSAPQVVLLTFGGNDINFSTIVKRCAALADDCTDDYVYTKDPATGEPEIVLWTVGKYELAANMKDRLANLYHNIADTLQQAAPKGNPIIPVVVLPYPQIITSTYGDGCSNMNNNERQFGVQLIGVLNETIQRAVNDARQRGDAVYYARNVATSLLPGHTACADTEADRYVNDISIGNVVAPGGESPVEQAHPDKDGHRAIANSLVDWSNSPDVAAQWDSDKTRTTQPRPLLLTVTNPLTQPALTVDATINTSQPFTVQNVSTGGQLTVQGGGYAPNSEALIIARSAPRTLGTASADSSGNINTMIKVPTDLARGQHLIEIDGYGPDGKARLTTATINVNMATPLWVVLAGIGAILALAGALLLAWRLRRTPTAGGR